MRRKGEALPGGCYTEKEKSGGRGLMPPRGTPQQAGRGAADRHLAQGKQRAAAAATEKRTDEPRTPSCGNDAGQTRTRALLGTNAELDVGRWSQKPQRPHDIGRIEKDSEQQSRPLATAGRHRRSEDGEGRQPVAKLTVNETATHRREEDRERYEAQWRRQQ